MPRVVFGEFAVDMTQPDFLVDLFQQYMPGLLTGDFDAQFTPPSSVTVFDHTLGFGNSHLVAQVLVANPVQNSQLLSIGLTATGFQSLIFSISELPSITVGQILTLLDTNPQQLGSIFSSPLYIQAGFGNFNDVLRGSLGPDQILAEDGNDTLFGLAGDDFLEGGRGADTMFGGPGDDAYHVHDAGDVVVEKAGEGIDRVDSDIGYTLPPNVENLQVFYSSPNAQAIGNELDNVITFMLSGISDDSNDLVGGLGNDTLDGGLGADTMTGGGGNDSYVVDDAGDQVIEHANEGVDTVRASVSWTLGPNVEILILTGALGLSVSGNELANALTGNTGDNPMDGGRGIDSMAGGLGDDIYKVDNGLDQVNELAGQGSDTIVSQVPQTLTANIENLTLADAGGNIEGIGNAASNVIVGNNAPNLLDGGAGNDQLKGQGGDDTVLGGAGDDVLSGGLGRDVLSGGAGADHFVFDAAIASGTNVDQVMDFAHGQDVIDLSAAIFVGVGTPGTALNAADFVIGAGGVAHDGSDHVIHDTNTGMVYYDADGSGAQPMVAFAQVAPGQVLTATDFHLLS